MSRSVFCTAALTLVASTALAQAVATSIPMAPPAKGPVITAPLASIPEAPPASDPVITPPLTSVPITSAVPPPVTPTYDHSYWLAPIWPEESHKVDSGSVMFDRGVNSEAAAAEWPEDGEGTSGRSLGEIARDLRLRKQAPNARELTNDDFEQMYGIATKANIRGGL